MDDIPNYTWDTHNTLPKLVKDYKIRCPMLLLVPTKPYPGYLLNACHCLEYGLF